MSFLFVYPARFKQTHVHASHCPGFALSDAETQHPGDVPDALIQSLREEITNLPPKKNYANPTKPEPKKDEKVKDKKEKKDSKDKKPKKDKKDKKSKKDD